MAVIDLFKTRVVRKAIADVRRANTDLHKALADLSLAEFVEIVPEVFVAKPVVITVDAETDESKGELVILKLSEKLDLGILMWSISKGMMMQSGFVASDSICMHFMGHKIFFEVFSGAEVEHRDQVFALIAKACEKNGINSVFLLHPADMYRFFSNTICCNVAVIGIKDFLDEADKCVDIGNLEFAFLDLAKSSALDFHEYCRRCGIRDDLEV